MQIEFDTTKDQQNRAKHGLSLADAALLDWDLMVVSTDTRKDYQEARFIGLAPIKDRIHVVAFTIRGEAIRIISLRKANKREVKRYEKSQI